MGMIAAITLVALLASPAPASTPDPLQAARADLTTAHAILRDNFVVIQERSGIAAQLQERLDEDTPAPGLTDKPGWMGTADFVAMMTSLAQLEKSLLLQYATGAYHRLAAVRGADDTLFKSPVDGTMQPLAAYVPKSYDPAKPTSLIVFLHGRGCSENTPIALPWLQAAADSTNSIVVAPYARGDSQYVDPAPAEVYAALDAAKKAFNVDPRRIYLAGHSMGGYGVFIVGPRRPQDWAAMLAVSGGMTTETLHASLQELQGIPVYLVVGSDDPIVPQGYMRQNADLLTKSGIETHFYEQPGGLHAIGSIDTAFEHAWHDMLRRTRSATPSDNVALPATDGQMPGAPSPPATRP